MFGCTAFLEAVDEVNQGWQDKYTADEQGHGKGSDGFVVAAAMKEREVVSTFEDDNIGVMFPGYGKQDHSDLETGQQAERTRPAIANEQP